MKLLYITNYNNKFNKQLYYYNIINNIYNIINFYEIKIINFYKKKNNNIINIINKNINKLKNNFYIQYEDKEILKYILYLKINNNIKFTFFKNNNIFFLDKLYKLTIKNKKKIIEIIKKYIINWEINRLNIIDLIILKMAICEFYYLLNEKNNKYIKIIISEYIKISNLFSSNKSKYLINGILDKIFKNVKKL
ncbi:MAG: hypothetical protein NHG08_00890 [Candidatus Shikimatogenerans sp. JK-2022]|nr:hypothetical protein [Candidatus Shikimatogenerans bostrichidophilus]